jgi:hypothetical protein
LDTRVWGWIWAQRAVLFSSVDWFLTDVYLPQKDIAVRCLRLGLVSLRHQDVLWKWQSPDSNETWLIHIDPIMSETQVMSINLHGQQIAGSWWVSPRTSWQSSLGPVVESAQFHGLSQEFAFHPRV